MTIFAYSPEVLSDEEKSVMDGLKAMFEEVVDQQINTKNGENNALVMKEIGESSNEVYALVDFLHETTQQDIVNQTERMDGFKAVSAYIPPPGKL